LEETGFENVEIGPAIDTFGGASGEENARKFAVSGHAFLARKPL
jgi:arsenite methyltransferase